MNAEEQKLRKILSKTMSSHMTTHFVNSAFRCDLISVGDIRKAIANGSLARKNRGIGKLMFKRACLALGVQPAGKRICPHCGQELKG